MSESTVSVIICTYTMNRLKHIHEAVESVLAQTLKSHEIILSVDHNKELLQRLESEMPQEVRVVLNEGARGLSETRNVAIRSSSGKIVAFMDDDAVAKENWLKNLVIPFHNSNVMAVGGEALPVWPKGTPPFWFPDEFDWTIGCTAHNKLMLEENGEVRNVTGSNMAFRRDVFREIGLWDIELGAINGKSRGGEEANICLRIKGGIDQSLIMHEPTAITFHKIAPERATLKHLFSYCWDEGFSRVKMRKVTSRLIDNPLSAEVTFLRRLLTTCILRRIRRFYKVSSLAQIDAIMISLTSMGTAYLIAKIKYR